MPDPDPRRGVAFRARTSRLAKAALILAVVVALLFTVQFFSWLDTVQSGNGWSGLALISIVLPCTAVGVFVVLILGVAAFSDEPSDAARWALGLGAAMALLLLVEFIVLGSVRLSG